MAIPFSYQELEQIYANSIGKGARSIAVTASNPKEGTSSVVCALAQRAKAVGYKVLVVDLNLNHPSVTKMLNTVNQELVNQEPISQEYIDNCNEYWLNDNHNSPKPLCLTDGLGLSVIPAPISAENDENSNPQQLRIREQTHLNALISVWQQQHDVIIFDTSPLTLINKNNIPAQTVASCCDGTLLVVQTGKTKASDLSEAMSILRSRKVNLLGTVMNENKTPLLAHELSRQCEKLKQYLPLVATKLQQFFANNAFLQRQF